MQRILVSEFLQPEHLERLGDGYDVVYNPDLYADRPELLGLVADADAIVIRNRTEIDQPLISAAQKLKVVGRLGVGLDNIDLSACASAGVEVIPALGANAVSVAEYVIGMMLVLTRPVFDLTKAMIAGEWPARPRAFGEELMGKTLGLVGYGYIGQQVAARAAAFGMTVIAYDPYLPEDDGAWHSAGRRSLSQLLAEADVVSVHAKLTDETRHLIDRKALERMKPAAILINTSRGGTVDEVAVAQALRDGVIGAAALDVFESEPLLPEQAVRFADLENVILTPHIAGNTAQSVDRVAAMTVDAVRAVLNG